MSKMTCAKALNKWEEQNGVAPSEAETIKLIMQIPLLEVIDQTVLGTLNKCVYLSLACNAIDKMRPMPPLRNLRILALSRNKIRRINGLDEIGDTLEELWLSYNQIDTLNGLHPCRALKALYMSNNKIKRMEELDKLRDNPKLVNVLFMNNPIYENKASVQYG